MTGRPGTASCPCRRTADPCDVCLDGVAEAYDYGEPDEAVDYYLPRDFTEPERY